MTHKDTNSFEPDIEFSLSKLMALDVNEIPDAIKGECFAAIMKFAGLMSDPLRKVAFYRFMLKHYNRLDSKDSETLAVNHLKPILDSGPANAIQELMKSAQEFEAPILNSAAIVSSLATRIKNNLPDQSLIEYFIEKTPPQLKGQATSLIVGLIQSNDPRRFAPALKATVTKRASLPREELDKVCVASVDGVRRLGISQASTFLDPVLTMLPDTSGVASKVLTDFLVENLKSDDPNARSIGANYYRKIRDDIAHEKRGEIAHQLILKLQSMSEKLDQVTTVIDLVLEDQGVLGEQYRNQFIDLLLAQLSTARPVNVQLLGINSLARMKELGRRADRILEEILALAKASPQVREACKQALDSMRKFKGSKAFWKQVEELR
jgi:hypothetical protein